MSLRLATTFDLLKCLKLTISLHTCEPISELPSNILSTISVTVTVCKNCKKNLMNLFSHINGAFKKNSLNDLKFKISLVLKMRIKMPFNIQLHTICPRSLVHFYIATHCIKWNKTSWACTLISEKNKHLLIKFFF